MNLQWEDDRRFNVSRCASKRSLSPTLDQRFPQLSPARGRAALKRALRRTYLIGMEGTHLVKIGIASDPLRRLASLQTAQPVKLSLLWTHHGDHERFLHAEFSEYRTRGEWFDFSAIGEPVEAVAEAIARQVEGEKP